VVLSAMSKPIQTEWCAQRCPNQSKPSGSLSGVPPPRRGVCSAVSQPIQTEWFAQRCPSSSPGSALSDVFPPRTGGGAQLR